MPADSLHPTLWRTCRVLANETRLRLLAELVREQPQNVSQIAEQCALTLPVASQSLRALEARGLLKVRRIRLRVEYRLPAPAELGTQASLLTALKNALRRDPKLTVVVIRLATAFTHPSRIEIYRALQSGPKTVLQIQTLVRLSSLALNRHLAKLLAREFVRFNESDETYTCLKHAHPIGQALGEMAQA